MIKSYVLLLVVISAIVSARVVPAENGTLRVLAYSFYATDLSGCDLTSDCDPGVAVYISSDGTGWSHTGESRLFWNDNNPIWSDSRKHLHRPGTGQAWKFDLRDYDELWVWPIKIYRSIATFTISVDEFVAQGKDVYRFDTPSNQGTFWLKREWDEEYEIPDTV